MSDRLAWNFKSLVKLKMYVEASTSDASARTSKMRTLSNILFISTFRARIYNKTLRPRR